MRSVVDLELNKIAGGRIYIVDGGVDPEICMHLKEGAFFDAGRAFFSMGLLSTALTALGASSVFGNSAYTFGVSAAVGLGVGTWAAYSAFYAPEWELSRV